MTKNELIAAVAGKAQMTKTAAATAVEATFDAITSTLKIICENVEPLRPLAVLMSGEEHAGARARPGETPAAQAET